MEQVSTDSPISEGTIKRLVTGKLGLANTFWGAYILGSIPFNLLIKAVNDANALFGLSMAYAIYMFVVCVGVWKAASLFEGKRVWAWFAKILAAISIVYSLVLLISLPIVVFGQ